MIYRFGPGINSLMFVPLDVWGLGEEAEAERNILRECQSRRGDLGQAHPPEMRGL